jgi:hypothetical protein
VEGGLGDAVAGLAFPGSICVIAGCETMAAGKKIVITATTSPLLLNHQFFAQEEEDKHNETPALEFTAVIQSTEAYHYGTLLSRELLHRDAPIFLFTHSSILLHVFLGAEARRFLLSPPPPPHSPTAAIRREGDQYPLLDLLAQE